MDLSLKEFYQSNKLIHSYLDNQIPAFHSGRFSKDEILKKAQEREFNSNQRERLIKHLEEQYHSLEITEATKGNISKLRKENTFTITTGHQCNIFGGSLFFLFKILQVVNICEELNEEQKELNFVPVFWMASEDHDFEEIASVNVFNDKLTWDSNSGDAVGRMDTSGLEEVLTLIESKFREGEGEKIFNVFREYVSKENLANATMFLVNKLFGEYGIVILDADSHTLKKEFSDLVKNELTESKIHTAIHDTIIEFDKQSFKVQVNPREINLFYLFEGKRNRIVREGDSYKITNTALEYCKQDILALVDEFPERFSPNVAMRPMYQELVLPNLAYLGGAGEIAYWLEFKKAFDQEGIHFPILIVRNSLILMEKTVLKKLDKLNLSPNEFLRDEDLLVKQYLQKNSNEIVLDEDIVSLRKTKDAIKSKGSAIDPSLVSSVEASFAKFEKELKKIEGRFTKSLKQKSENEINAIKAVKSKFYPNGVFQERYENFTPYYINFGSEFIQILKNEIGSFEQELKFVDLEQYRNHS